MIYSCTGSLGCFVMWASYFDFSSPHLRHHSIQLYLPSRIYCRTYRAAAEILDFSWRYFSSSAPGHWLTDWEVSWHLRFEMRGLCSQHIPFSFFKTLPRIFLREKYSFCWKVLKAFLCQCTAHYGELHEDRKEIKFKGPDSDTQICKCGSELYFLSLWINS